MTELELQEKFQSIWKPYPPCPSYFVSQDGRVYSSKTDWLLSPSRNNQVSVYYDGDTHTTKVSNLVYLTFVGPIPEDMSTGYIDGDSSNNSLENIKLVPRFDRSSQVSPQAAEKRKDSIAAKRGIVKGYGPHGEYLEARTIREMESLLGGHIGRTSIGDCINGKRESCKGWSFERVKECAW